MQDTAGHGGQVKEEQGKAKGGRRQHCLTLPQSVQQGDITLLSKELVEVLRYHVSGRLKEYEGGYVLVQQLLRLQKLAGITEADLRKCCQKSIGKGGRRFQMKEFPTRDGWGNELMIRACYGHRRRDDRANETKVKQEGDDDAPWKKRRRLTRQSKDVKHDTTEETDKQWQALTRCNEGYSSSSNTNTDTGLDDKAPSVAKALPAQSVAMLCLTNTSLHDDELPYTMQRTK